MRKKISLYMAIIMAFGALMPLTIPSMVQAFQPGNIFRLEADMNQRLVQGGPNYTPVLAGNSSDQNALIYWPLTGIIPDDQYVLTWYPEDEIKAEMTFRRRSDNYGGTANEYFNVDFNLFSWINNEWVRYSDASKGGQASGASLKYSVGRKAGGNDVLTVINNFLNVENFDDRYGYKVNGMLPGPDGLQLYPPFNPFLDFTRVGPVAIPKVPGVYHEAGHWRNAPVPFNSPYDPVSNPNELPAPLGTYEPEIPNLVPPFEPPMIPNPAYNPEYKLYDPNLWYSDYWRYVKGMAHETQGIANTSLTPNMTRFFQQLSPSFNISQGDGFTFEYFDYQISFLWGTRTFSGLGESPQPSMMVSVNKLQPGRVYDFTLDYKSNNPPPNGTTHSSHVYVFPGLDIRSFEAIPFTVHANKEKPLTVWNFSWQKEPDFFKNWVAGANGWTYTGVPGGNPADHPANTFDTSILDLSPEVPQSDKIMPGTENNGLSVRFDLPKSFNRDTKKYETVGEHGVPTYADGTKPFDETMGVSFTFRTKGPPPGEPGEINMIMSVHNFTKPERVMVIDNTRYTRWTPSAVGDKTRPVMLEYANQLLPDGSPVPANLLKTNRIEAGVINIPPNTFFHEAFMNFTAGAGVVVPGGTTAEVSGRNLYSADNIFNSRYRPIFTFNNYEVRQIGSEYYLGITQFNAHGGDYQLYQFQPPQHIDGDPIYGPSFPMMEGNYLTRYLERPADFGLSDAMLWFPLNINPLEPIGNYYQVRFRENPQNAQFNVFSQIIIFNPQKPGPSIVTPDDFRIMNQYDTNHLVNGQPVDKRIKLYLTEDDPRGETAHLEFWTQWDIANAENLKLMMERAVDEGDGIVRVEYRVNKVFSPMSPDSDPNDPNNSTDNLPEAFSYIMAEIRRNANYPPQPNEYEVRYSVSDTPRLVPESEVNNHPLDYPTIPNMPKVLNNDWQPIQARRTTIGNRNYFTYYADVHFLADAARIVYPFPLDPPIFYYPSVYFMNVKPIHLTFGDYDEVMKNPASKYDSMTLSDITHTMPPPPQHLTAIPMTHKDTANNAMGIPPVGVNMDRSDIFVHYNLPLSGVKLYLETMFPPEYPAISVNLYIGTNEAAIRKHFYDLTPNQNDFGQALPELADRSKLADYSFDFTELRDTTSVKAVEYNTFTGAVLDMAKNTTGSALTVSPIDILRNPKPNPSRTPTFPGEVIEASSVVQIRNVPIFSNTTGLPIDPIGDQQLVKSLIQNGTALTNNRIMFNNLDINQKYYIYADLVITQYEDKFHQKIAVSGASSGDNSNTRILQDPSPMSGLTGVTTAGNVEVPGPTEIEPKAPRLRVRPPVEQSSATIEWDKILPEAGSEANVRIEYEIIRLDGWEMSESDPDEFNSKEVDFISFFNKLGGSSGRRKTGWRTDKDALYIVVGNELRPIGVDSAGKPVGKTERFDYYPEYPDNPIIDLKDNTLQPNNLYFYYVRTLRYVNVTGDKQLGDYEKRMVSSWSRVTVTTTPVQAPRNLKVERERTDYDRMNEVIVSWESDPLPMENYGTDFIFQYMLKKDEGEWTGPHNMPLSNFVKQDGNDFRPENGSYHYLYKLTGLDVNSTYQMRVCLFDIEMNDRSLYTNTVTWLTGFSQPDYDKEKEEDEWLEYIRKKLQELLGGPYWITFESEDYLSVVVRPSHPFNELLLGSPTSAISIYTNDADNAVYYIPASVLLRSNNGEKGFRIPYSDLDILTAPRMINETINDTVLSMTKAMKSGEISDYFVKLTVQREMIEEMIEEYPALTKQTDIRVDAIGTVPSIKDITAWDESVFNKAVKLVDEKSKDPALRQAIRRMLDRAASTEDMMSYLDGLVMTVRNEIMRDVHNQLRVGTGENGIFNSRQQEEFEAFDASMFLIAKGLPEYTVVNGFSLIDGEWVNQLITDHHNGKAITTRVPGRFLFSGREVNIPGIEYVPKGGNISAFTAKYGLEDFLGYDGVDLTQTATRYMVAGCVARMAGAPKDADPIAWISANLNMTPSSRNANSSVQVQEAAAMVMALYEKKSGTNINRMTIRNFQTTARMAGLDDRYTQAVRAGFETGVLTDTNMRPADNITIRNLLEMLAALDGKIKL